MQKSYLYAFNLAIHTVGCLIWFTIWSILWAVRMIPKNGNTRWLINRWRMCTPMRWRLWELIYHRFPYDLLLLEWSFLHSIIFYYLHSTPSQYGTCAPACEARTLPHATIENLGGKRKLVCFGLKLMGIDCSPAAAAVERGYVFSGWGWHDGVIIGHCCCRSSR